jgi:hypothetical protein
MMVWKILSLMLCFAAIALFAEQAIGQDWTFVKEKDGIRVYIKKEQGNGLKSFKGVTDYRTTMAKVNNLIGNVENQEWWDKNVKEIKVLHFEKGKVARYYLVYDSPWPVSDRDLCVEALISTDPVSGVRTVSAKPLLNVIPEKKDLVRIKDYSQKWTLEPTAGGLIHATLEGYVDPGGSVPDWVYNMVITETPIKVMGNLRKKLEN